MIAKHDGTELFMLDRSIGGRPAHYLAVPGGVVIFAPAFGASEFIPMCRVEYDLPTGIPNSTPVNVRLTSTLPQLMMASAMAGLQAAGLPIDGLGGEGGG